MIGYALVWKLASTDTLAMVYEAKSCQHCQVMTCAAKLLVGRTMVDKQSLEKVSERQGESLPTLVVNALLDAKQELGCYQRSFE